MTRTTNSFCDGDSVRVISYTWVDSGSGEQALQAYSVSAVHPVRIHKGNGNLIINKDQYSSDGKSLAKGDPWSRTIVKVVHLWDTDIQDAIDQICRRKLIRDVKDVVTSEAHTLDNDKLYKILNLFSSETT